MIELARTTDEELDALAARTRAFAERHNARWVESELQEYDANTLKCIIKRRPGRGGKDVFFTFWDANGCRVGRNELNGILSGRWKWPTPVRKPNQRGMKIFCSSYQKVVAV